MKLSHLHEDPPGAPEEPIPPELAFLRGAHVDFGFENLGLDNLARLRPAFTSVGVLIPGTPYRLVGDRDGNHIKPATGMEKETLPPNWPEAVYVLNSNDEITWAGKLVRPEQIESFKIAKPKDQP